MKRLFSFFIVCATLITAVCAAPPLSPVDARSAVLVSYDGDVVYEQNPHEALPPASVTKIMTVLLVMENIEAGIMSYDDIVTASEHASSMGGTQIYLEPGEQMTVRDLLKSVCVSSANDAAVALGEHIAGSEDAFVSLMNARAKELGMNDTNFVNATGLDAAGHVTSAYDVALMSVELLKHPDVTKFTTIWIDTVRDGKFGLANTNKMLRTYDGMTGLKTGFTSISKYCLSASAKRGGVGFIAVAMASPSVDARTKAISTLLNYGFANYTTLVPEPNAPIPGVPVLLGERKVVMGELANTKPLLMEKTAVGKIEKTLQMAENVAAPVEKGQTIGTLTMSNNGQKIAEIPVVASESIGRVGFGRIFWYFLSAALMRAFG